MLSGSAPLAPEVVAGFQELTGIPVHQGYGLTEAAPVVTSTLLSGDPGPGSLGAPLPGVEVRLVDETGAVGRRGPGRDPDPRRQPLLGLLARRRRRPGRRRLVGHRRHRLPRPRRRPVPGRPARRARRRVRVQRLPPRGRGRDPGRRRGHRGRRDRRRRTTRPAPRSSPTSSPPGVRDAEDAVRRHCAERLARFKQPARIEVVEHLPGDRHRQGREGPAPPDRAAARALGLVE